MDYDAWLSTDRNAENTELLEEAIENAWILHCWENNISESISDPDHVNHDEVYQPWLATWTDRYDTEVE